MKKHFFVLVLLSGMATGALADDFADFLPAIRGKPGVAYVVDGKTIAGSDGTAYQVEKKTIFSNYGVNFQINGNTVWGSNGINYQRRGNTYWGSDGKFYEKIGGWIYSSNGMICSPDNSEPGKTFIFCTSDRHSKNPRGRNKRGSR